jgi:hypothetical protein
MRRTKNKLPVGEWILGGVLVVIVIVLLVIYGFGNQAERAERPNAGSTETVEVTPVEEEAEQQEPSEPEQERPFPDTVYSGSGDTILPVELPVGPNSVGIASITHTGSSDFSIWALDENLEQVDLLVDANGNYTGTVPFNLSKEVQIFAFEITADGPWTVTLKDVLSLEEIRQGSSTTGEGDGVFIYRGKKTIANVSHQGQANFSLGSYKRDTFRLLVDETGNYSGKVAWRAGPLMLQISADGAWSIEPQ